MARRPTPGPGARPTPLSARLERLFEVHRPDHALDRSWRNSEVVVACREQGYDLSETNLSELRRGIKTNPTMRTVAALGWFFQVSTSYFTDTTVAPELDSDLLERKARLDDRVDADKQARSEAADATKELRRALREVGATGVANRAVGAEGLQERTRMMRALTEALMSEPDDPPATSDEEGTDGEPSSRP